MKFTFKRCKRWITGIRETHREEFDFTSELETLWSQSFIIMAFF